MKLKTKLASLIIAFAMVVGVLMVGVYAVKKTNFSLGGNISFSASGINATISAGVMAGGNWVTSGDASTKMKSVEINTNKTESQIQSEFASWSGLDFTFNEAADDVTITFTITNNSKTANDYLVAYINVNDGTAKNAYTTVTNAGAVINPDTTDETENVETFVVTFRVKEKDTNASLEGFTIEFDLRQGPVTAESSTDTTVTYEGLTYAIGQNNTLLMDYNSGGSSASGDVVIPAYIKNGNTIYTVTNIGVGTFGLSSLTSISIPASVTIIGNNAFQDCKSLTSITIPDSVTEIGTSAFQYCTALTSISIPYGVNTLWTAAFAGCSSLTSITIPNSVTRIESSTFAGCIGLTSITIPNSVTRIESSTFAGCIGLTSITIPNSVTRIESSTFAGCIGLTSITIPDSVTEIGTSAFQYCTALTSISIPGSVPYIGLAAFDGCSALRSVTLESGILEIHPNAFNDCVSLTSITIPDSVTKIYVMAFDGCTSLKHVYYEGTAEQWASIQFVDNSGNASTSSELNNATIHYDS